ncbi:MAG: hypothetical protein D6714_12125 [Bacteroidetes bacterium]|nr:MAG: hypothetical protein D6714_12125 [Bacteroidota bacterium]
MGEYILKKGKRRGTYLPLNFSRHPTRPKLSGRLSCVMGRKGGKNARFPKEFANNKFVTCPRDIFRIK